MAKFHEAKINNFHFMNFLSWYEIKIDPDDFLWHIKLFHEIDSWHQQLVCMNLPENRF